MHTDLAAVVEAVLRDDVVDMWVLDRAEHQCLAIVLGPVVQVPHVHTRWRSPPHGGPGAAGSDASSHT